jgi:sugar-specific transcriptional regulator TrmB
MTTKNMDYIKTIQSIGLKRQEAEIYLACLELGMAKVAELAEKLEIPRTSIYVYLKNLVKKGYVKKSKKQAVEYFVAVEPKQIQKEEEEKIKNFSKIVPLMEKMLDFPGKKPKVEYYDTANGILKIYESMLAQDYKTPPLLIESAEAMKGNFEKIGLDFWYDWEKKFLEKGVITQGVITASAIPLIKNLPEKLKKVAAQRPATVRVIDDNLFPFSINLYLLYPDKIFIIVSQENFVITIQNKNIYKSLTSFFHLLYAAAKPIDIKKDFEK